MSVARLIRSSVAAALLVGGWGCATMPPSSPRMLLRSPLGPSLAGRTGAVPTVVLDAGHGGQDPGTSHFGLKEKSLTLDIVRALRGLLQQEGLQVTMTRDADRFIPLSQRPDVANRLNADVFVSVHVNANRSRHVSGAEVYYPRESQVSSSALWPPQISASEIGVPSTTVRQLLWDVVLTRSREESQGLASAICHALQTEVGVPCRGTKPARFVVLRESWMPAVLVEVGYVTNRTEAGRLQVAAYRQALARAIANGILAYLQRAEAEVRAVAKPNVRAEASTGRGRMAHAAEAPESPEMAPPWPAGWRPVKEARWE